MHATLEQMTVWGLISEASLVVQAVMLILVLASLTSWYLIVQRGAMLRRSDQQLKQFQQQFRSTTDLAQLYRDCSEQPLPPAAGLQRIFHAGYQEFARQRQTGAEPAVAIDNIERSLYVTLTEQEERLESGLPFLATVGSVSPYIGLFGTVWGIMNAFLGLSQVQQATLSTVAPGIAEALIATAIGLFAAIPAVMAYNRFSSQAQRLMARYYSFGNELQVRLQRSLQDSASPIAAAA